MFIGIQMRVVYALLSFIVKIKLSALSVKNDPASYKAAEVQYTYRR